MGLFNNVGRYSDIHEYIKNFKEQTQSGLKLDVNNNYDIEGKRLANVGQGVDDDDAVVMHQFASLDTGLETKLAQLKADSLQVDGSSHMTGDLDLRGQKLINPGEIEMNRKLITNLGTDENNDLSAVNMITLKKFHPDVPAHTHEVTKDIDLKELFNVIQSKQRSLNELKTHYDSLVSFEEVKENFLSRQEEFPMQTQLNMNHNSITNLKDPEFGGEAATKSYADKKLDLAGGTMTGELDMGTKKIRNLGSPISSTDAVSAKFLENFLTNYLHYSGGTMSGQIDMNNNKIINLPEPTEDNDAVNMEFLDSKIDDLNKNKITATSHPKDEFRYLMEDPLQSSSESNTVVTGIVDFQQSPHKINKKAYALKINKRSSDNMFLGRLGFNMFKLPEGEYTICVEFFPAKIDGVNVNAVSTALNVNRQATKVFKTYSRSIIHMHKWRISPPEYLMLDLKWQGKADDASPGNAHLIIYGVKEFQPDVESAVFDSPFAIENGVMTMETDLNLNGKRLLNYNPKSKAVIMGNYRKATATKLEHFSINGETAYHVFGFDFTVKKITLHVTIRDGPVVPTSTRIYLKIFKTGKTQRAFGVYLDNNAISYSFDFAVGASEELQFSLVNRSGIARANVTILIEI